MSVFSHRSPGARWLATPALVCALACPSVAAAKPTTSAAVTASAALDPAAVAAYQAALRQIERGEHEEAIGELDLATELEPAWSAPVRARAEAFGVLAHRHRNSAAFLAARAADLQRLLALEPGVDTAAREQELAALQLRRAAATRTEQRHRKLQTPALIVITSAATLLIAGALLYGMKPNAFLQPTAYLHERRTRIGLGMLLAGAAMVPPAIALGVLAGRQARRDSAVRAFNVNTGRPRATLGIGPKLQAHGGGVGLHLSF